MNKNFTVIKLEENHYRVYCGATGNVIHGGHFDTEASAIEFGEKHLHAFC